MNKTELIQKLNEFNTYASEIFELSFPKKTWRIRRKIHYQKGKGTHSWLEGMPKKEAIKASCNDLRKFIQPNDTLEIKKLTPLYNSNLIDQSEKLTFNKIMSSFDKLNQEKVSIFIDGEQLTRKKILEVFLYGNYSHRSEEAKKIHDSWQKNHPLVYQDLEAEFIVTLNLLLQIINNLASLNKMVLEKLKFGSSGP